MNATEIIKEIALRNSTSKKMSDLKLKKQLIFQCVIIKIFGITSFT